MAIFEHNSTKPTLDLNSTQGNVFHLISTAKYFCEQLNIDPKPIAQEMMSKNYSYAIFVLNREFGKYFDLILPHNLTIEDINNSALT